MQCPECKTSSVQSKGYRTKGVHRYLCNLCGRNFTVDNRPKEDKTVTELPEKIQEEVKTVEANEKADSKDVMKSIAVSLEIHQWLTSLKLVKQESYDSVLKRMMTKQTILQSFFGNYK